MANKIDAIESTGVVVRTLVSNPQQLGLLIRAVRRSQRLRLDDVAGSAGVGHVFARDVEYGKETVQLGRVLRLLAELGITLEADVPDEARAEFDLLQREGLRPVRRRKSVVGEGGGK